MPRFFKEEFGKEPFLTGGDAKHIALSLRMKVGEELIVSDTKGTDFLCRISGITPDRIDLTVQNETENLTEPHTKVTLFQCLPKGDKMDLIVRQAVELGIYEIYPVLSERCISRPDKKSIKKKTERWQKIADEASGQSGRGIKPKIQDLINFPEYCKMIKEYDVSLFFYEAGGEPLKNIIGSQKNIAVTVGCEGGFSVTEAAAAAENGARTVTLGKRILRCETAPTVAAACVMLLTDNM